MRIAKSYRLDAVVPVDSGRPVLEHVSIETFGEHTVAVAADGFCLVVVPVGMEEGDIPGLVDGVLFGQARRANKRIPDPLGMCSLQLEAEHVTLADGSRWPRLQRGWEASPFPVWQKLLDTIREPVPASERPGEVLALNLRILNRLDKGFGHPQGLTVYRRNETKGPFLVAPFGDDLAALRPPFGLFMPLYVSGRRNLETLLADQFAPGKVAP